MASDLIKLPVNYLEVEEIYNDSIGKGMRSVAVTASNSEEGTSTLAYALGQRSDIDGKRTLLVEVNMLHPELGDLSGHAHNDWFPDPQSADACVMRSDDTNLDILPAPCNADAIVFRSVANMSKLMQHWLEKYDVVIFDTSPVNARNRNNIPAESICAMADGAILMVMAGVTRQTQFKSALDRLAHSNVTLVGIVFNDYRNPRLADEICRETHRLDKWLPNAMAKIRRKIKKSSFFNIDL